MASPLHLIILGVSVGPCLAVAWLWMGRCGLRGATRFAASFLSLIAFFQVLFWVTAPGLGWFTRGATMGLAAVAVLCSLVLLRRRPPLADAGGNPVRHTGGDTPKRERRNRMRGALWGLLIVVLVACVAGLLFRSLHNLPFLPDDYGYHLVSPLWWIQGGQLTAHAFEVTPEMAGYYAPINGYPRSFEVVAAILGLWSGHLGSTGLTWILFFLPGVLLTWELLRRWEVDRGYRMLAVILVCSHPIVQLHAGSLYTDVATAALFPCALFFLLRWLDDGGVVDAALFGLSIGLVAGFKVSGSVHACVMLAVAVGLQLAWKRRRIRTLGSQLAVLGTCAIATGGAWYIFNLLVHGNPVYPISVEWRGLVPSLEGPLSAQIFTADRLQHPWRTLVESLRNTGWFWTAGGATHSLGPWFVAFGLPAFAAAPLVAKKRTAEVGLVSALIACAFLVQPMRWYPRFIFFAVWCSAILICVVAQRLHHLLRPVLVVALVMCVLACLLVGWPQTLLNVAMALDYKDLESWSLGSQPWNLTAQRLLWEFSSDWRGRTILVPSHAEVLTRCQSPDLAYRLIAYDYDDPRDFARKIDSAEADLAFVMSPNTPFVEGGEEIWDLAWTRSADLRLVKYDLVPVEWAYRPSIVFWDALFEIAQDEGGSR